MLPDDAPKTTAPAAKPVKVKAAKVSYTKLLSANRLRDGAVVYAAQSGDWTTEVTEARVAANADEEASLTAFGVAAVRSNTVVDPNLVDNERPDAAHPRFLRERIRATGPTVRPDLCRAGKLAAE